MERKKIKMSKTQKFAPILWISFPQQIRWMDEK